MKLNLYNLTRSGVKTSSLSNVGLSSGVKSPKSSLGPGLALVPNENFLDPADTTFDNISWLTVVENNDPTLKGSPVTPHIIKVE